MGFQIKFDVNRWLEDLRQRRKARLKNELRDNCPHVEFYIQNGSTMMQTRFISLPGDLHYTCQMCGKVVWEDDINERLEDYWFQPENFKNYKRELRKFLKIRKKLQRS